MATYQIGTPGGYEVEVRAETQDEALKIARENWQTMPRIIHKEGDTRVFERPNGQRYIVSPGFSSTDPAQIEKAMGGASAGEISRQSIDEALISQSPVTARAQEFVRGTPFIGSYADEAAGLVGGQNATLGLRALSGAMQRQHPGQTLGLNLAGGLAGSGLAAASSPAALGGAASSAIGQGTRVSQIGRGLLAGAGAGAIEGGVYGAGEGANGTRAESAGVGAAFGGVGGGLIGGLTPVAREVSANVASLFSRGDIDTISKQLGISKDAARVIKNTFDQGGDMQAAVANLNRAGGEAMLADAGQAAQSLLDAAAQSGGDAGSIVRGAIDARMARTGAALSQSLDDALGASPAGPRSAVDAIAQRTAPARREAYELAYNTPIDYSAETGRQIESVLDRIEPNVLLKAIDEANADMRANGLVNQQIMAIIGDGGDVTYREMPNVQQLDEIKKAMQRIAYENTDDFGRLNGKGQRYNDLARQLRDAVAGAAEPYGVAVQIGGDNIAEQRAFTVGQGLLSARTNVEDIAYDLGDNPSQAQISAAKSGLRSYIDTALGNVRAIASDPGADALEARQVIKAVTDLSSDNSRAKIRRLMGSEADALLSQIDEAAQSASVRAAMSQNSKTAARLAQKETVEEITSAGPVQEALQGELVGTAKGLVRSLTGQTSEFTAAQRQKIYSDIARALTEKTGDDARTALAVLGRAMEGQKLTDAQTDQLANLLATTIFTTGAPATGRSLGTEYRE